METASLGTNVGRRWQEIAQDIEQERNPARIRTLTHELNETMLREERMRVVQKMRTPRSPERVAA
jgi:hypothetical protein